jgi:hypothetical protein
VYKAVTTTKTVTYHSIVDSVVSIDKGSRISTKNLVYDAETGSVLVSRTNNEFDSPIYNTSFPAYWAYGGMGLAYKNTGATYKNVNFYHGSLTSGNVPQDALESGDELYLLNPVYPGTATSNCDQVITSTSSPLPLPNPIRKLWVVNQHKQSSSLIDPSPDFIFVDENGNPFTGNNISFKIVRSGHRNMLDAKLQNVISMTSPIMEESGTTKLKIINSANVLQSSAVEFQEKWRNDNGVFYQDQNVACGEMVYLRSLNPYSKGLLGTFRGTNSKVFNGERKEDRDHIATSTNLPKNGYLKGFSPYWYYDAMNSAWSTVAASGSGWITKDVVTKVNERGMEIETKNALDIFTSAQYGYHKSLPVAITTNSDYNSMAADGFEDYNFDESINTYASPNNRCQKHIDLLTHSSFTGLGYATLINTTGTGFSAHTGKYVLGLGVGSITYSFRVAPAYDPANPSYIHPFDLQYTDVTANTVAGPCTYKQGLTNSAGMMNGRFTIPLGLPMYFSTWVREACAQPCNKTSYTNNNIHLNLNNGEPDIVLYPTGSIIDGWQRYEGKFTVTGTSNQVTMTIENTSGDMVYFDDFRFHPFNANMKCYTYDPVTLRLASELDANNYATFYEYDEEGTLVRTKAETKEGVKTITETRSAKQSAISEIQD